LGISEDITEQKQRELERTERELLLRLIFETGPGCIKRVAADGTLLHMNPAGLEFIEAKEEIEVLGLSVFDLVVPEHVDAFRQMHQKVIQGEHHTLQFEIMGFKGTRRWMETHAVPFNNPITKEVEQLAVTHDITKRKGIEDLIRKGDKKFRAIFEQAPTGIAISDSLTGQFQQINLKYCDITGYSQEEMLNLTFQELTHPDDLQTDLAHMQKLLTDQIDSLQLEKRYIQKNGETVWVNLTCVPLWLEPQDPRLHIAMVQDITERKRAEKRLQESEERYRVLYEDNPSMYFTVTRQGTIISVNRFGAQQLGYSVEELVGQPVINLFIEEEKSQVQKHFEICLQNPLEVFSWEFRKIRKDGSIAWVKEAARTVHSRDGDLVVLIVCEDISVRKETEKALQESKALTENILGQLPKGFAYRCLNNKEWSVIYASDGIEEVTGVPVSDLLSGAITYESLMAPGENERVWPMVQDALAKQLPYENEHQIITRDGEKKWILARGRFIFDETGKLLHLDGLNVDITEHKQIENELRTSEARFRSLVNHIIYEIELNGQISSTNKAGRKMIGVEDESQVIERSYFHVAEEPDHRRIKEYFFQAVQGQDVDFEFNVTIHGNPKIFTNSFIPIRGSGHDVLKIVWIADDITERRQAEKDLHDSEAKRIDALRQSDDLKSALLSSVSHELRTPLTAIKTSVSSLLCNTSSLVEPIQQEFLTGIDQEINYMSRLVDNLLDMSQIEAGTLVPHREWYPLEDLIEGALRRVEQVLEPRSIEIHMPENIPPVYADAVKIQQVLINLFDNAIKYSSQNSPIQLHVLEESQQVIIQVSNLGEPLQAQDLEQIFDRFYRRPLQRNQPIRGTGLGLAICKGIIEAHGGRIWAESTGSKVSITLSLPVIESMANFSLEGLHKG
jgi:PAS domain S-box-containing protein